MIANLSECRHLESIIITPSAANKIVAQGETGAGRLGDEGLKRLGEAGVYIKTAEKNKRSLPGNSARHCLRVSVKD